MGDKQAIDVQPVDEGAPFGKSSRWLAAVGKIGLAVAGALVLFALGRASSCFEEIGSLKATTEALGNSVEKIDTKIDTLDEKIDANFGTLDEKVGAVGNRVDRLYDLLLERFGIVSMPRDPGTTVPADEE